MNYITIEEKAWLNLINLVRVLTQKVELLSNQINPTEKKKWLDGKEVCSILNISTRALQSYRDNGIIGYTYVVRKCLYKPDEIKTMLDDTLKSKCNV